MPKQTRVINILHLEYRTPNVLSRYDEDEYADVSRVDTLGAKRQVGTVDSDYLNFVSRSKKVPPNSIASFYQDTSRADTNRLLDSHAFETAIALHRGIARGDSRKKSNLVYKTHTIPAVTVLNQDADTIKKFVKDNNIVMITGAYTFGRMQLHQKFNEAQKLAETTNLPIFFSSGNLGGELAVRGTLHKNISFVGDPRAKYTNTVSGTNEEGDPIFTPFPEAFNIDNKTFSYLNSPPKGTSYASPYFGGVLVGLCAKSLAQNKVDSSNKLLSHCIIEASDRMRDRIYEEANSRFEKQHNYGREIQKLKDPKNMTKENESNIKVTRTSQLTRLRNARIYEKSFFDSIIEQEERFLAIPPVGKMSLDDILNISPKNNLTSTPP